MTTPTIHEVMLETRQRQMAAMARDPLEDIQREIDRHSANEWSARRSVEREAWEATAAALEAQKVAIAAEL